MSNKLKTFTNGIIKENPVLVLVLGTCPAIATSTTVLNALGMGLAATFVLLGSNIVISLLRKIIPNKVRIPCFIVVIAGFVSVVQLLLQAYAKDLYNSLGIFLPLIVVNCIILGRAEMFASKNSVLDSALDGLGMGIGFTLALFCMATIREILGSGTWLGFTVLPSQANFIFAKSEKIPGGDLYRKLKENGILVRWFDADRIRDYVRITIGSLEQMASLVDEIARLLEDL